MNLQQPDKPIKSLVTASTDAQIITNPPAIKPMTTNSDSNDTMQTKDSLPPSLTHRYLNCSIKSHNAQTTPNLKQQISPIHQIPAFTNLLSVHKPTTNNNPISLITLHKTDHSLIPTTKVGGAT